MLTDDEVRTMMLAVWAHIPDRLDRDKLVQVGDELLRLRAVVKQHDLCHDLHGKVDAQAFADGCAAEQRRIYGCAPDRDELTRLRTDVAEAVKTLSGVLTSLRDHADVRDGSDGQPLPNGAMCILTDHEDAIVALLARYPEAKT